MSDTTSPDGRHRLAAIAAIALIAASVGALVMGLGRELVRLVASAPLLAVAVFAMWYALTRTGWRRFVGAAFTVAALIGIWIVAALGERTNVMLAIVGIALLVVAAALGRWALGRDVRTLKAEPTAGARVAPAARGVLLINPHSGGGKAERLGLEGACTERGIEPVVLDPGDDLQALALDAIERGADVIGMAGGDGSQAVVASVAAARDVAMVVVPAGTRNHLALDLGLDRDDLIGALEAFGDAVERRIDLGEVNGRVFVNNVSLGLYASIVRSPEYRDAKIDTTLSTLPSVLGPGSAPFDLSFVGPDGTRHDGAHVVQVSNNPYGRTPPTASRPRLDTHRLGVITLEIDDDRSAARFFSTLAEGHPERYRGFAAWTPTTFEVCSKKAVDVGLDGESLAIAPPLSFSIRPDALHVRLPIHSIGESPGRRALTLRSAARGVWDVARGRSGVSE
ncbi:MAG TPA: diacylglycerol kinase family protein [Actinomycetota bacterium]|nr:diacylglycerol kinase family protein [Actinomycetota bacterium]